MRPNEIGTVDVEDRRHRVPVPGNERHDLRFARRVPALAIATQHATPTKAEHVSVAP
jgi:hypothetical protein